MAIFVLLALSSVSVSFAAESATHKSLPVPDPPFTGKIGETYKDSTPSYPAPVSAPKGSPNVLIILLDDVGFGMCRHLAGRYRRRISTSSRPMV